MIVLFVPFKADGFMSWSLWHWTIDAMGTLTFDVFGIWLIVAAVFVNKFGNGGLKVGSLSLDQAISVLSGASFTFAFVHLLTSVQYWHVGAYLAFFAALIAFFAGVFTMLPFFSKEFAVRDDVAAHPKARPTTKRAPHPAPVANMPGAHNGPGGFGAPYSSEPNGPIGPQGHPGAPVHPGQPGGPGQFGGPDQFGQPGQPGQPSQPGQPGQPSQPGQVAAPAQSAPAGQFSAPDQFGQPNGQDQFGQLAGAEQNSPYAPPEQRVQESSFDSAASADDSADQAVQSTGSGQTYLGAQHSLDPQHTQSEPTQTFGFGAHREESQWSNDGETAVQAPVSADSSRASGSNDLSDSRDTSDSSVDSLGAAESESDSGSSTSSGAGTTAAVAGAGAMGVGAAVAGAASASSESEPSSESERRRGRHAAPSSDTESEAADARVDSLTERPAGDSDRIVSADREAASDQGDKAETASGAAVTSTQDDSFALTDDDSASPAESSSFATKVNAHDSDTNLRASEGISLKPEDESTASTASGDLADSVESANAEQSEASTTADEVRGSESRVAGPHTEAADDDAVVVSGHVAAGVAESGSERTTHPEADEPTQYVPVAGYGNGGHRSSGSGTGEARSHGGDNAENAPSAPQSGAANASSNASAVGEEETVVQSAVQPGGSMNDREDRSGENRNGADQDGPNRGTGQNVIQAFWFAVPEPREAVDATTGMPVFTIYPGDWFLGLEDNGSWFKVRDSDGREGLLRNTEGVQRG
ncbi:hypothetical protein [Brevibacterium sp.]|nr:hypothetical protein [Brevibacterium sp.]